MGTRLAGELAAAQTTARTENPRPLNDADPFARLRPGHARLVLLDGELDRVRAIIRDSPVAKRLFTDLEKEAEKLQTTLPIEYKLAGTRLLNQSRRALDRIGTLTLLFRLTGKESYLHRAILELKAAAGFRDWNPGHFLDTAEMTHAFAIGYDWLYPALSFEDRAWMAAAIANKGLDAALATYQAKPAWANSKYYWNPVCNTGMILGALAVADEFPEKSLAVLKGALESLPHALGTWAPDGGWPEGAYYWDAATRAAAVLFAAWDSVFGSDLPIAGFTHGLDRAGRYRIHTTGPSWKVFNFGDSPDEAVPAPQMQWFARHYGNPAFAWQEQRLLERLSIERPSARPDFYDLVWFARDTKPPQAVQMPLDAVFHGVNVATFRSSWDDPNALFLAVKGGDNKVPHTHLDLGSFVLDAGGVRFASDLGPDEVTLPAPPPAASNAPGNPAGATSALSQAVAAARARNGSFRARTDVHNTLTFDGEGQDGNAEAKITRQEPGQDLSWVQIDLSKANGNRIKMWQRRAGMAQRQSVLLEDIVQSDHPVDIVWGMLTDADISVNGQSAVLQKGKWSLSAEIRSPRHAVFDQAQVRAQGYRRLIVRLGEKTTDLHLSITFTPYRTGTQKPKINVQFPV